MKRKRLLIVSYIPSQSLILIRTHLSSLIEGTISGLSQVLKRRKTIKLQLLALRRIRTGWAVTE